MKIWFPIKLSDTEETNTQQYRTNCTLAMYRLRGILSSNVILSKWKVIDSKIKENNILNINNNFDATNIPKQFLNNIKCYYDNTSGRCYYWVPDDIRCTGSKETLSFVIRLTEYGNDIIAPTNWIRHSYRSFNDYILEGGF